MISEKDFQFIQDVFEIAKYLNWRNEVGALKAQAIIDNIHKGKYGSKEGVWPQFAKLLERLKIDVK